MISGPLDEFCGSQFWNWDFMWNGDYPKFTLCFQKTVLVWVPCLFLWIFSGISLYSAHKTKNKLIPWNILNISKLLVCLLLMLIQVMEAIIELVLFFNEYRIYFANICEYVVKAFTFTYVFYLIILHRFHGLRSCGILFLFWFAMTICSIPKFLYSIQVKEAEFFWYIFQFAYFTFVLLEFFLHCFADGPPVFATHPLIMNPLPDESVSFPCKLFSVWFDAIAVRAYRFPAQLKNFSWNLQYDETLQYLSPLFQKNWDAVRRKKMQTRSLKMCETAISIFPVLWKCFGTTYIALVLLKSIFDVALLIAPQILRLLINYMENSEPAWHGYFYAVLMSVNGITTMLFVNWYFYNSSLLGLKMRTTLISAIYSKALIMSNNARRKFTIGQITNLMSADAQKFYDFTIYLNMIVSCIVIVTLALYFLWQILGASVIAGLIVICVCTPINAYAAAYVKALQIEQMKNKDERVKITNEVLSSIKVLKMYSWERSYEKEIIRIRNVELNMLKKIAYVNTLTSFFGMSAPFLMCFATFAVYTISNPAHILDAQVAFVSLAFFNVLRFSVAIVPTAVTNTIQAIVAGKRISKYLSSEDLDANSVSHYECEEFPVIVENGTFSWEPESDPVLKDINIKIKANEIVAIVGTVGCGKSTLISAILGETNKMNGLVNTWGKIAYVPQQAWIQNATLKDNILFMNSYDEKFYKKVVKACALETDFDILPAGDETEIGEKGVNLSGGQKQRISLARAVYSRASIYLLDDPLSAVDAHVGKHIFDNVIGPSGLLKNKTRILVTHGTTYLPDVDYIIQMKDGSILECGNYQELMANAGHFSEFLKNYSQQENKETRIESDVLLYRDPILPMGDTNVLRRRLSSLTISGDDIISIDAMAGEKLIKDENLQMGNISISIYAHYVKSGKTFLWILAVLFTVMYQASMVGANLWLTKWSTDPNSTYENGFQNEDIRNYYLAFYGIFGICQLVTIIVATYAMYAAIINASKYLHEKLLNKIIRWPSYMFDVTPLGRILNRFSYDIDVLDNTFPIFMKQFFTMAGSLAGILFVIAFSSPLFILVMIPVGFFYIILEQLFVAVTRQFKRLESISRGPIYSHFSETLSGISLIRAYGMQEIFREESDKRIYANQKYTYPGIVAVRWVLSRLEILGNGVVLSAALFGIVERGRMSSALIGLSISYAMQISIAINWIVRAASDIETNIVAVERIKDFQDTRQEFEDGEPCENVTKDWPQHGCITFENFKVKYREGLDLVLRGISLQIKGGEKIGIAGRTGAGKSSLTLSLFRIIEASGGRIIIDDVNISKLSLPILRSRLTIIPQDPVLFSGTLRMNLDPFEEYTDVQLWNVIDLAHLKAFVSGLREGLYFKISESGENLSVGQRQLICLARALLRKTKILILDEATAAVDLETDDLIQKTIRKEFKECTILTIAHRLNTIMDSDKVLVLDNGLVKEFDHPKNLLSNKAGLFYRMVKDADLLNGL